jgi:hypothetical protein
MNPRRASNDSARLRRWSNYGASPASRNPARRAKGCEFINCVKEWRRSHIEATRGPRLGLTSPQSASLTPGDLWRAAQSPALAILSLSG